MSLQTTIPFVVRKNWNFYGRKEVAKEDFSEATARDTPSKYVPTVKKIVTLSSSESDTDSDVENAKKETGRIDERRIDNAIRTPKRRGCDESDEDDSSPRKQRRGKSSQSFLTPSALPDRLNLSPKKESKLQPKQLFESDLKCSKLDKDSTPHKQRRGKPLQSSLTPSTLLSKLDLSPKKDKKLQPKQLFESNHGSSESNEGDSTPRKQRGGKLLQSSLTPSTLLDRLNLSPKKESKLQSKQFGSDRYQNARLALHSSATNELPGREDELARLQEFLQQHLKHQTSGSLYVSGPPGTGKTASLSKIMQQQELKSRFKMVYINCTTMKSAAAIYGKIIQELSINCPKSRKSSKTVIEKYLTSKHKTLLLVLDEIDQLESKKQSVLYSIFEWPSLPNSKLILVGIANALDLTDRILPRLQARCELKPMLIHFASYTKQQIINIISARLSEANAADVFTPSGIQLLAGKVAAMSGDIRKALDISRRVVELAESHKMAQILRPTNDNETNTESPKKIVEDPVDLKEIVTVLNGVYGGTQNLDKEEDTFPLQQKLLVCSLLLILNKSKNKDVNVGRLHEVYKKVCKKRNICAVDTSEFVSLCSLIETRGILKVAGKKEPRLSKVNLLWDQEELDAALRDKNMMAEIINDASCL